MKFEKIMTHQTLFSLLLKTFREYFPGTTQDEIADALGITPVALSRYLNGRGIPKNPKILKAKIKDLFDLVALRLIIPLRELEKVEPAPRKKDGTRLALCKKNEEKNYSDLKTIDGKPTKGIYIFYNSQRKVIYVGKTERGKKRSLWDEMNNQLHRPVKSYHSINGYIRTDERLQGEDVRYISAYGIIFQGAIHNIEALLIRAYANDNTNVQMARFRTSLKARRHVND